MANFTLLTGQRILDVMHRVKRMAADRTAVVELLANLSKRRIRSTWRFLHELTSYTN